MRVIKTFNNNIALVEDEKGSEVVLMGKGIAFQKRAGDLIDESKIEKRFVFDTEELNNKFMELFDQVPVKYIVLTTAIIDYASEKLPVKLDETICIALADHITYAIERYSKGEVLKNALLWEIKKFYADEYAIALHALDMIEYETGIKMAEDEAGFIAMHFVNAQQKGEAMDKTVQVTKMVEDILQIVEYHFHIKLDESSLNYVRFVTHIRYFARRVFSESSFENNDDELFEQIKTKYPQSYVCSLKVQRYIDMNYGILINKEEMVYFMLHIHRVCTRAN